jgi:uncharacterized ferritin-like protein (DUF455 family)
LFRELIGKWRSVGDEATANALDGMLADEVQHVRFGNQWLKRLAREDPRTLMDVAKAVDFLARVTKALAPAAWRRQRARVDLTSFVMLTLSPISKTAEVLSLRKKRSPRSCDKRA